YLTYPQREGSLRLSVDRLCGNLLDRCDGFLDAHSILPVDPWEITPLREDLHGVVVRDDVLSPHSLALEARRRAPHAGAATRRGQLVVDRPRDVQDRRRRMECDRFVVRLGVVAEEHPDQ